MNRFRTGLRKLARTPMVASLWLGNTYLHRTRISARIYTRAGQLFERRRPDAKSSRAACRVLETIPFLDLVETRLTAREPHGSTDEKMAGEAGLTGKTQIRLGCFARVIN